MRAVRATVHGRVQGVGFRFATLEMARALGIVGWVRNTMGGSVEVIAQGPAGVVEPFLAFLREGPRAASVSAVDVIDIPPDAALHSFDVRF